MLTPTTVAMIPRITTTQRISTSVNPARRRAPQVVLFRRIFPSPGLQPLPMAAFGRGQGAHPAVSASSFRGLVQALLDLPELGVHLRHFAGDRLQQPNLLRPLRGGIGQNLTLLVLLPALGGL